MRVIWVYFSKEKKESFWKCCRSTLDLECYKQLRGNCTSLIKKLLIQNRKLLPYGPAMLSGVNPSGRPTAVGFHLFIGKPTTVVFYIFKGNQPRWVSSQVRLEITPNYKAKKIERKTTKTYYTSF